MTDDARSLPLTDLSQDEAGFRKVVRDFAQERYPHMLSAPTEDYGPSISSLEYFAKEQTPAPPLEAESA